MPRLTLILLAALFIGCHDDTTGLVCAAEPLSDEAYLTPAESDLGCWLSPADIRERAAKRRAAGLKPPITEAMVRALQKNTAEVYIDHWGTLRPPVVKRLSPAVNIEHWGGIGEQAPAVVKESLTTETAAVHGQTREMLAFSASWCGPCRKMHPIIEALMNDGAPICEVDADSEHGRKLKAEYKVKSFPTYIMLIDGKEVARVTGATSRNRLEVILGMEVVKAAPKVSAETCGSAKTSDKVGIMFPTLQVLRYVRLMNRRGR